MMENDFGFSAVSEIPENPTVKTEELPSKDDIKSIHYKLDLLLDKKEVDDDERVNLTKKEIQNRLEELHNVVMPLYKHLLSSADKEYIYWPNRKEKIEIEIAKIQEIMDRQ